MLNERKDKIYSIGDCCFPDAFIVNGIYNGIDQTNQGSISPSL